MSVGSVCLLGEPWLELLADRFLLLLATATTATATDAQTFRRRTFLRRVG